MRYLKIEDICESLSVSRRTLERLREGNFPEPDFYIGKSPRWEEGKLNSKLLKMKFLKKK